MPFATLSTASNASLRIPAWKRLGLQLKTAPAPLLAVPSVTDNSKRKRLLDEPEEVSPPKKKKSPKDSQDLSAAEQTTPKFSRKKSVTFTPETKSSDGESIKKLFKAWVEEQKSQDLSRPVFQISEPATVEENFDTTLDEKERRTKRVKKSKPEKVNQTKDTVNAKEKKTSKKGKISPLIAPPRPFLVYLKQYSESRENWKFNKNHQNHLLKHIFNVDIVPAEYDIFIYEYVRGLQGGVRTRLRDTALAIKVRDQEDGAAAFPEAMADRTRQEYDGPMKEYVATMMAAEVSSRSAHEEGVPLNLSDGAMPKRVAKRIRAERILRELGPVGKEGESSGGTNTGRISDNEAQKRLRMNDGSSQKVARKRKQRTVGMDEDDEDETSSSGSSSDSDESSSSEDDTTAAGDPENTSSSSSSSSSSGSEEESESESEEDSDDSDDSEDSE